MTMRRFSAAGWLWVLASIGLACRVEAGVIEVSELEDAGPRSLRAAISQAAPGDTIRLTAAGTFVLTEGALRFEKDLSIEGLGASQSTLDGGGLDRAVWVSRGVRLRLQDLTIANGRQQLGGGIFNDGGIVELDRCSFHANRAVGADATDGTGLAGNPGLGGAVYNLGELAARGCAFTENAATGGRAGSGQVAPAMDPALPNSDGGSGGTGGGGAVYNAGRLRLDRCALIANQVSGGAGGQGTSYTNTVAPGKGGKGGSALGGALGNAGLASLQNVTLGLNLATGGAGAGGGTNKIRKGDPGGSGDALGGAVYNLGFIAWTNVTCATNRAVRGATPTPFGASTRPGAAGGAGLFTCNRGAVLEVVPTLE